MRPASLLVVAMVVAACSSAVEVSPHEVEAARDRLRPPVSGEEIDLAIEDCLEENAITSYVRAPGGGFAGRNVTERDSQVFDGCRQSVYDQFDWPPPQATAPAEHMVLYELYGQMADCLEGLGYDIDMPSFDTYYESGGDWYPYDDLPFPSGDEWQLWYSSCPQDPWTYDLTGANE